jgi:hypothetical protein
MLPEPAESARIGHPGPGARTGPSRTEQRAAATERSAQAGRQTVTAPGCTVAENFLVLVRAPPSSS